MDQVMHKNIFLLSYLSAPPLSFFIPHKHQIFICFSLFWGVSPECPKSPVLREGRPWSHPQTSPKQLPWVPVVCSCAGWEAGVGQMLQGHLLGVWDKSSRMPVFQPLLFTGTVSLVPLKAPVRWDHPHPPPRTTEEKGQSH